jgi:hypothetical protein
VPPSEQNSKTARYREHRIMLTKWSNSNSLAPRYAFLSELILLWLDSNTDQEEKIWSLLAAYVSPKNAMGRASNYDNREPEELADSPVNDAMKAHAKELLEDFLRDESTD